MVDFAFMFETDDELHRCCAGCAQTLVDKGLFRVMFQTTVCGKEVAFYKTVEPYTTDDCRAAVKHKNN